MAYTTIDDPSANFQAKTFSGNAGTNAITFDGNTDMQPDLVWLKKRNGAANHHLVDSVRGAGRYLYANLTNAEGGDGADGGGNDLLASFNSNGFTIDAGADSNASGATGVAWSWKAGTSFTNDASATGIGTIDSTGSVNTDAGFSIVSYTGNGTSGATIAHSLGVAPSVVIVKNRDNIDPWTCFFSVLGNGKYIELDSTGGAQTTNAVGRWNNTDPSSTVVTLGNNDDVNGNTEDYIAYCFAEKKGYSKFGSYTGNGNADGTFIYTGFKPAMILLKADAAGENWRIFDNKRSTFNPNSTSLQPNSTNTEASNTDIDFCSNGIKLRTTSGEINPSGTSFIYMVFAENPFVTSGGVPVNAR